jgi:proteasome lid subunit RPN8/RPN11
VLVKPDRFDRIRISRPAWSAAREALRTAGHAGEECVVYFAGRFSGSEGTVTRVIVPAQRASAVHCEPTPEEIDRISLELVRAGETLLMQLHSHPRNAYLSATDRAYPASRKLGWLSAVAPNFGAELGDDLRGVRIYEYVGTEPWHELDHDESQERFRVEDGIRQDL